MTPQQGPTEGHESDSGENVPTRAACVMRVRGRQLPVCDPRAREAIQSYLPRWSEDDLEIWRTVLAVPVRRWAEECTAKGVESVFEQIHYLASFALDAYRRRGVIDEAKLFEPDDIDYFVFVVNRDKSDVWRKTAAAYLRRVGPVLAPRAAWPAPRPKLKQQQLQAPYSEAEEEAFGRAARAVKGVRRVRVLAAIALSLGAGADGRWIPQIEVEHVVELGDDRLAVDFPAPFPRRVPVRAAYTAMLREAMESVEQGRFLQRGTRGRGPGSKWTDMYDVWQGIQVEGLGTPKPARLRNTWVARHIANGTSLTYLAQLAGFPNTRTIAELLPLIEVVDDAAALRKALEA